MSSWYAHLGDFQIDSQDPSSQTDLTNKVLFLRDRQGRRFVVKDFTAKRGFARELKALKEWAPRLQTPCPLVVAEHHGEPHSILMTHVGGQVLCHAEELDPELHRQAGRILREIHDLEVVDQDPLDLRDALSVRLDESMRLARPWILEQERQFLRQVKDFIPSLKERVRVCCHGDFVCRNWIVDADGQLGLVDFEHARMDVRERDFLKLHMEIWPGHLDLRDAFFDGYGEGVGAGTASWLQVLEIQYLVGTVNWNLARGAESEAWDARRSLETLRHSFKF